jgi:hypothetical protein
MIKKHKLIAIVIAIITLRVVYIREGLEDAIAPGIRIVGALIPVLISGFIASISGLGWEERFASDYGTEQLPGPFTLLFWMVFLFYCSWYGFNLSY